MYTALFKRIKNKTPRLKVLLEALEALKSKMHAIFQAA